MQEEHAYLSLTMLVTNLETILATTFLGMVMTVVYASFSVCFVCFFST